MVTEQFYVLCGQQSQSLHCCCRGVMEALFCIKKAPCVYTVRATFFACRQLNSGSMAAMLRLIEQLLAHEPARAELVGAGLLSLCGQVRSCMFWCRASAEQRHRDAAVPCCLPCLHCSFSCYCGLSHSAPSLCCSARPWPVIFHPLSYAQFLLWLRIGRQFVL